MNVAGQNTRVVGGGIEENTPHVSKMQKRQGNKDSHAEFQTNCWNGSLDKKEQNKLCDWNLFTKHLLLRTQHYFRSWSKLKRKSWNTAPLNYIPQSKNLFVTQKTQVEILKIVTYLHIIHSLYIYLYIFYIPYIDAYIDRWKCEL